MLKGPPSAPVFAQYCRHLLERVGFDGSGKVLDVACGPGTFSMLIQAEAEKYHLAFPREILVLQPATLNSRA